MSAQVPRWRLIAPNAFRVTRRGAVCVASGVPGSWLWSVKRPGLRRLWGTARSSLTAKSAAVRAERSQLHAIRAIIAAGPS